jgi:hypothetical protein
VENEQDALYNAVMAVNYMLKFHQIGSDKYKFYKRIGILLMLGSEEDFVKYTELHDKISGNKNNI